MLKRNKNSAPSSPLNPVIEGMGAMATLKAMEATSQTPGKESTERAAKQLLTIRDMYSAHLEKAVAKSMNKEAIAASLIDGWNSGAIPRVVPGNEYRGSGIQMHILHGTVPADVFEGFTHPAVYDGMHGLVLPGEVNAFEEIVIKGIVSFESANPEHALPTEPNPNDPTAFYIETFTLPQIVNDGRFNADRVSTQIAEIDALSIVPTK